MFAQERDLFFFSQAIGRVWRTYITFVLSSLNLRALKMKHTPSTNKFLIVSCFWETNQRTSAATSDHLYEILSSKVGAKYE